MVPEKNKESQADLSPRLVSDIRELIQAALQLSPTYAATNALRSNAATDTLSWSMMLSSRKLAVCRAWWLSNQY